MKEEKRQKYIDNLYAALHTLSIKANFINLEESDMNSIVKNACRRNDYYYAQLNPNKVMDGTMLTEYSEFEDILNEALSRLEVTEPVFIRADLSFNSDRSEDYELFKKLNRLLICCIAEAYNISNCYQTSNLWSYRSLSVAIKSDKIEAENYNKELESHGQTEAKTRLELRSKRINSCNLENEFIINWFARLDEALLQFENVQSHYNRELARIWQEDREKNKKEQVFVSLTDFLLKYSDCIYTRKQLYNLLTSIGVKNPKNTTKKFKDNHQVEFFSKKDLKIIIRALKDATIRYFSN